jgi:tryptophan 2,3-dioxygenase
LAGGKVNLNPKIPSPDKGVTYSSYLKVDGLLSLQKPLSLPIAHDEMLFIIIHQVYELWFKLTLFELKSLIAAIEEDNLIQCFHILKRVSEIFKVLVQQLDILETMTPTDFNKFRSNLNPASGFQSLQFRELEIISGAEISDYEKFAPLSPEWLPKLKELSSQITLSVAFKSLLLRRKMISGLTPEQIREGLLKVYTDPNHREIQTLCESLISYDEQLTLWRFRHVQMVERMIGMKKGTGGSLGVSYLSQTLTKRFFPELWEVRTHLSQGY